MVLTGLLTSVGALLAGGCWNSRLARVGVVFLALSGIGVIGAGLVPWNVVPDAHDLTALIQAVAQWIAMVCLILGAGRGAFRWITVVALALSVIGFAGFVLALDGAELPGLGFGGTERLSFDTLTLWTVIFGITILRRLHTPQPRGSHNAALR